VSLTTLKGRASFRRVLSSGAMKRSNGIAVYRTTAAPGKNLYGFMVTTKVGSAVIRNRVRRWAKELLRVWDATLIQGYEIVVLANRPEAAESFQHFASHLATALKRLDAVEGDLAY
jgi:ribonuclease P protein component